MSKDSLEKEAFMDNHVAPEGVKDEHILSLIGIAKPSIPIMDLEDERLRYILSK